MNITHYYVTAWNIPPHAPAQVFEDLERQPRTDMARFYERAHAETHAATLAKVDGFVDVRVEERQEPDDR